MQRTQSCTQVLCWDSGGRPVSQIMPKSEKDDLLLVHSNLSVVKPKVEEHRVVNDGEPFERHQQTDDDGDVEILYVKESNDLVGVSMRESSLERKRLLRKEIEDFIGYSKRPTEDNLVSNDSNQLAVYVPSANDANQVSVFTEPPNLFPSNQTTQNRVLPSIGTFTVQCADCFKWRVVPTKEEYEAIRETILQRPFVCGYARKWRTDVSCDDPPDLEPDDSRIWAIDKPNISQPPPGWDRALRIRGEGSTKFADIYYTTPTGKRLRSSVEVHKFLLNHPEYLHAGVNLSQFSFQIPKPLNDAYVRKRSHNRSAYLTPHDAHTSLPEPVPSEVVSPLAWVDPTSCSEMEGNIIPSGYMSAAPCLISWKEHARPRIKRANRVEDQQPAPYVADSAD